jgi:hypothetical protein
MSFSVKYIELFRVKILHHYFLDKGSQKFNSMTEAEQSKQLNKYNFQEFIKVVPTIQTKQELDGHHITFSPTGSGFSVWTEVDTTDEKEPVISLSDDLSFTFLLKINDHAFLNYTDLKLDDTGKIYYFSNNRKPDEPGSFPLIPMNSDSGTVDGSFILSESSQTDELKKLSVAARENLFGIIRIKMKGEINSMNITDSQGKIQSPIPVFKIEFENRETTWRYIFDEDQNVKNNDDVEEENGSEKILVTKSVHPLTKTGFITVELDGSELPNPDSKLIKPDHSNNKIYSEIYM